MSHDSRTNAPCHALTTKNHQQHRQFTVVPDLEPPRHYPFAGLSRSLLRQIHHAITVATAATGQVVPLGADKQPIHTPAGNLDWRPIQQAVDVALIDDTDWTSWAERVDDHRFRVFDYDHPNPAPMLRALELWELRGWDWQAMWSGRPGHLQIWVNIEHHPIDDIDALCVEALQLGCDRRHGGALTRSLMAPHPWGCDVASVKDISAEQLVAWVTPTPGYKRSTAPRTADRSTWAYDLPDRGFTADHHRHGQFFAHLMASYASGVTEDACFERAEASGSKIAGYCFEKRRGGRRWFTKRWQRAVDAVEGRTGRTTTPPRHDTDVFDMTELEAAEQFAAGLELIDTATAAGCHMAHLYAMHCARRRRRFKSSCYDPAYAWFGDEEAVAAAHRGLTAIGLLTVEGERESRFEATTYELPQFPGIGNPTDSVERFTLCTQNPRLALSTWSASLFAHGGGLGTTAARVRCLLAEREGEVVPVAELARLLGRTESTIRGVVKALEEHGMCVYERRTGVSLKAVDQPVRVPEASERKRATVARRRVRLACRRAVFRRWELTLVRVGVRDRRRAGRKQTGKTTSAAAQAA